MSKNYIPYEVVVAAHGGDGEALRQVLKHYQNYIDFFSRRTLYDDYGNACNSIDPNIQQNIESMLIQQIIMKFDPTAMPPE